uniref:ANK_REP_REGION domain-containing protein n=1 Tax=Macrostomum lignano TaxID=282301 RepID=A0A1I8FG15_9PLAT
AALEQSFFRMTALHQAAFNGNVPMMQASAAARGQLPGPRAKRFTCCLNKGSQPRSARLRRPQPLHLACQAGHYEIVKTLLCSNSDPMLRTEDGRTAFDVACESRQIFDCPATAVAEVRLLPAAQRHWKTSSEARRSPASIWRKNGHVDVLRLLLGQQGANPNRMTEHGTCLHLAAIHGQLEAVKFLLEVS